MAIGAESQLMYFMASTIEQYCEFAVCSRTLVDAQQFDQRRDERIEMAAVITKHQLLSLPHENRPLRRSIELHRPRCTIQQV